MNDTPFPSPPGATPLNLLGVEYAHLPTEDGGDLYLTRHGAPFADHLRPDAWFEPEWFAANRERLDGTSTVYKVRTQLRRGIARDIVVKWCRVGTEIPVDTFTLTKFVEAEFNSPYEEFALVMEMRSDRSPPRLRTHKPMAIYVPAKRLHLWQTGRSQSKIERKKAKFRDVELDIFRQYILIYEWVKGASLVEAFSALPGGLDAHREPLTEILTAGIRDMETKGFRVLDIKPEHLIVRTDDRGLPQRLRNGATPYALIDFELLQRTPERERTVVAARRAAYLRHQKDRFAAPADTRLPPHLKAASVMGVDYIRGHSESTGGELWVVGRDPELFDYFLPERWRRTPRSRLSETNEVWRTRTKDQINLVWKVSRVGELPDAETGDSRGERMREWGYNSPFEEFALAIEMARAGVPVVYPRAIYMTGQESTSPPADPRRFDTHAGILGPDGRPVLRQDHNYITVWGYWNGADEMLAGRDVDICSPVSLAQALRDGGITSAQHEDWLARARRDLAAAGFEDLNPEGGHLVLSLKPEGGWLSDETGPVLRWCNVSLVRRLPRT